MANESVKKQVISIKRKLSENKNVCERNARLPSRAKQNLSVDDSQLRSKEPAAVADDVITDADVSPKRIASDCTNKAALLRMQVNLLRRFSIDAQSLDAFTSNYL